MPNNITHIEGYPTAKEAREAAAEYQVDGYTTVQIGPSAYVQVQPGTPPFWPIEKGTPWFIVIASKDPMTAPAHHAAAAPAGD